MAKQKKKQKKDAWQAHWRGMKIHAMGDPGEFETSIFLIEKEFPKKFSKDFAMIELVDSLNLFFIEEPFMDAPIHWEPQEEQMLEHVQYDIKKAEKIPEANKSPFSSSLPDYVGWSL